MPTMTSRWRSIVFCGQSGGGVTQIKQLTPGIVLGKRRLAENGNIQQGEYASVGNVDDVFSKSGECMRSRRARVNRCGHALGNAVGVGWNAQRS